MAKIRIPTPLRKLTNDAEVVTADAPSLGEAIDRLEGEYPGLKDRICDEAGEIRDVGSGDVNEYLRTISGQDFTAKDFRTWAGTALAAQALQEFQDFDSKAAAKRNITRAIEGVAERLGNTQAICRKCYVHPAIIDAYMDRSLVKTLKRRTERALRGALHRLSSEEAAVLALLQQRMEQELTGGGKPRTKKRKRAKRRMV